MPERPNVVVVMADQHRADAVGVEDDSYDTPNIDALAQRGSRFTGCYSTHPQCSPARSSLLTGLYPHQTGVQALPNWRDDEAWALDPDSHSVGRRFRDAGYATGWFGRWDLGEDNAAALGWETTSLDVTGSPGEEGKRRDDRTVREAIDFVESADEPFFLTASFNMPHRPYYVVEAFADSYDPADVTVPASFDDDLADKPAHQRAWAPGDVPEEYRGRDRLTEAQFRGIGYRYRTMVSQVDSYLGRIVDALDAGGVADETVVVFLADHGDMVGGHGLVGKHTVAYEEELRVPLIIDRPGDQAPVVDDLVSLASVPGTLLELAGLDVPPAFEGGSLAGLLDGDGTPPSAVDGPDGQRVFFEHKHATGELHPLRGVRTPDWKYVDYFNDGEAELYDLDADPLELENLADDPAHAETRERLHRVVLDWWERTGGDEESWATDVPD
ncbi:MAG: sulfatase-like hydrolase/transferase [Halobacteriaceae archaeon]